MTGRSFAVGGHLELCLATPSAPACEQIPNGDPVMSPISMTSVARKMFAWIFVAALHGVSLAVVLGDGGVARAQETPAAPGDLKQLSLEQLGDVEVVSKSKSPEQIWKTAAAIYVITQEDIRRSGATTIPEALRLAPGVEVARVDGNKWSIGIRGFGSRLARSVLVLMDGRSVYTPLLAGTYWEVQDTVMEDIDRIEVIRGPGGTVWGPNAVNGVINIITKNSKDTQGMLVAAGGGNEEQGFSTVRIGATAPNGLSYKVYAKEFNRSAEDHPDDDRYDHWKAAQGGFRVDWVKNQRDSFTLQGDLYDERAGEEVSTSTYSPPANFTLVGNEVLSGGNLLGQWTRTFDADDSIQLKVYYDRTNRYEPNFNDIRNTGDFDFLERFHWGARHHFSWGLGANVSSGRQPEVFSGLYFSPNERTDQIYSAFLQDSISLVENRLTLEVGTKIIKTNYTDAQAEPSGRLLWTPTATQTLWLAVTRALRTPSDAERDFFLSSLIGSYTPPGQTTSIPFFARFGANPNFESEKLNGYELGYRRLLGRDVYVDVAGFFNQYDDLFSEDIIGAPYTESTPAPTHELLPAEFGNGLQGTTAGGEIGPEWRPTSFWRLRGSYSFLHMAIRKGPNSLDVEPPSQVSGASPQHQLLAQSSFDLPKRIKLDLAFRYESSLPAYAVKAYSTGDARLAWRLGRHWEISAVGENLLQPDHVEFPSDAGPNVAIKRSAYLKILWTSKEN
jgi:iron complex outermembrane receptor protein